MSNLKGNLSNVMDNMIARDEKLDEMMRKTSEMSDLSYSMARKVIDADGSLERFTETPSGAAW